MNWICLTGMDVTKRENWESNVACCSLIGCDI